MCQFHSKIFIGRPVSAVWPFSVTDNLRGSIILSHTNNNKNYLTSHRGELPLY